MSAIAGPRVVVQLHGIEADLVGDPSPQSVVILLESGPVQRARMFASCGKCGARSATFVRGPGGAIRARRWEAQHRCAEPRR